MGSWLRVVEMDLLVPFPRSESHIAAEQLQMPSNVERKCMVLSCLSLGKFQIKGV